MDVDLEYTAGRMVTNEDLRHECAPGQTDSSRSPETERKKSIEPKRIWLDDVRCAGTEGDGGFPDMANHWRGSKPATLLHHCYNAGVSLHNCKHREDVHLQCTGQRDPDSATQEEEGGGADRELRRPSGDP